MIAALGFLSRGVASHCVPTFHPWSNCGSTAREADRAGRRIRSEANTGCRSRRSTVLGLRVWLVGVGGRGSPTVRPRSLGYDLRLIPYKFKTLQTPSKPPQPNRSSWVPVLTSTRASSSLPQTAASPIRRGTPSKQTSHLKDGAACCAGRGAVATAAVRPLPKACRGPFRAGGPYQAAEIRGVQRGGAPLPGV